MKTISTWLLTQLKRHCVKIAVIIYLIPVGFYAAMLINDYGDARIDMGMRMGKERGIYTPVATYDQLANTAEEFKARGFAKDLNDYAATMHWLDLRKAMHLKLSNDVGNHYEDYSGAYRYMGDNNISRLYFIFDQAEKYEKEYTANVLSRYPEYEVIQARKAYEAELESHTFHERVKPNYATLEWHAVIGYLVLCLCSPIILLTKAVKNGFKIRYEWRRMPAVMIMHPLMLMAYPWGTPKQQLQKTLRFAAGLLSLILSAFTFTITASAQTVSASKGKQDCYALIDDRAAANPESALLKLQGGQTDKETAPACTPEKTATASASKPTTSPRFVVNSTTEFWNEYVGMNLAVFNDQPVLQQTFRFTHRATGFYVQPFVSMALTNRNHRGQNFGNEADLRLGWNHTFNHGLNLDVAGNYVNVSQLYRLPNGDVIQVRADFSRKFNLSDRQRLTPFLTVSNFHPVKGAAPKRGTLLLGGTNYNFNSNQFTLGATIKLVADGGPFAFDRALLLQTELDPGFKVRGNLTWYPMMLQFNTPLTTVHDRRGPELAIGSRLAF